MSAHALPSPGIAWGPYPERVLSLDRSTLRDAARCIADVLAPRGAGRLPRSVAHALARAREQFAPLKHHEWIAAVQDVRRSLRREGLTPVLTGVALGLAGTAMSRSLGKTPYDTQYYAAWLILQNRLAEMATGEGKTLAAALAAGVAALGDVPVHVLTANDYLVRRDRESMRPFFVTLGLSTGCVFPGMSAQERRHAYRQDITYATAKEVAFDYLKDHLALAGERDPLQMRAREIASGADAPILAGLCMAIVDEADSILLDEAGTPLILSAPVAQVDESAFRGAYAIAGKLWRNRDYTLERAARSAALTSRGREAIAAAIRDARGTLVLRRRAEELVEIALAAKHLFQRDRDYAITKVGIEIIDEVTGRIATGRIWSNGLHQMIEIKEGVAVSKQAATIARITYQRFFPRYVRLGGMSGTLTESRRELRVFFGTPVARVPLAKRNARRSLGTSVFRTVAQKWQAVVARAREMRALGRPVLIGTDSVEASEQLSRQLTAAGIAHQVLNALQDADEAQRVARAGERGAITVATNIAGRGTDIHLGTGVAAVGGLHVIACMRNRARRIDRQLAGRCARHGDPGSVEQLLALEDSLLTEFWPLAIRRVTSTLVGQGRLGSSVATSLFAIAQRAREWSDFYRRRQLRIAERRATELYAFSGGIE
jgi:preprotein translocase subunit SecA